MKKLLTFGGLVVGIGVLALAVAMLSQAKAPQSANNQEKNDNTQKSQLPPAQVVVTRILEAKVTPMQVFVGSVIPVQLSKVGSAASGRVETLFLVDGKRQLREGDRVEKGEILAELRTGVVQAEVDTAAATLELRKAELEEIRKALPLEEKQAEAKFDIKQSLLKFLHARRERAVSLGQAVSREDLDEILSLAERAQGEVVEAKAVVDLWKGPRKEKLPQAQANVDAAKAELKRLQEQLDRHTMRAPFSGYIVAKHTEVGEWVLQGDPIAEIASLDEVAIQIPVLEDYIAYQKVGDEVNVEINAFPGRTFKGTIAVIIPQGNMRARTFPVKVYIKNERVGNSVLLKSGMLARVELPVGEPGSAIFVPRDAVVLSGQQRLIYIVDKSGDGPNTGIARPVPIDLGRSKGNLVEARPLGPTPLRSGDLLVIEGNERLLPMQPVRFSERAQATEDSK